MFEFLNHSKEKQDHQSSQVDLYAPADGFLMPISEVDDPIFSQKLMGNGYAIEPENGEIFSPVDGKLSVVFPTHHALGIETTNGVEVLLHMGIGKDPLTEAFTLCVKEGQYLRAGDSVATIDLACFEEKNKKKTIMVLLTNTFELTGFEMNRSGHYQARTRIGKVEKH